jgi:hypothetical protein
LKTEENQPTRRKSKRPRNKYHSNSFDQYNETLPVVTSEFRNDDESNSLRYSIENLRSNRSQKKVIHENRNSSKDQDQDENHRKANLRGLNKRKQDHANEDSQDLMQCSKLIV